MTEGLLPRDVRCGAIHDDVESNAMCQCECLKMIADAIGLEEAQPAQDSAPSDSHKSGEVTGETSDLQSAIWRGDDGGRRATGAAASRRRAPRRRDRCCGVVCHSVSIGGDLEDRAPAVFIELGGMSEASRRMKRDRPRDSRQRAGNWGSAHIARRTSGLATPTIQRR